MSYRRLEYAPFSPFHDIEGTVAKLRARHPGISDEGVNQAIRRMLYGYKPRRKGLVVHLFGADIMVTNLATIPAWDLISPGQKQRIASFSITQGDRVPQDIEGPARLMVQEELAKKEKFNAGGINRSVLISPPDLKQTYVWRYENGWIQEVREDDYTLILSTPNNRRKFRDPDIHGPYVAVRSYYAGEARDRAAARTVQEADYLVQQLKRKPQWQGATIGDE